jgi:hypothetical protein
LAFARGVTPAERGVAAVEFPAVRGVTAAELLGAGERGEAFVDELGNTLLAEAAELLNNTSELREEAWPRDDDDAAAGCARCVGLRLYMKVDAGAAAIGVAAVAALDRAGCGGDCGS